MKTYSILCLCAALLPAAAPLRAQTPVRVTAHNVNLRAMPRLENSEVLGQAQYDERLTAWEIGEEWISITPPPATDFWISKAYVQQPQNTIGATRVNVRAGPSINYNVVDTLELGAVVEPREEISDWLKIAPPPTARVWIHRDFVDILSGDPEPARMAAETAEVSAEPARKEKTARKRKAKAEPAAAAAPAPAPAASAAQAADWPTPIVSPSVPVRETASGVIPVPPPADLKLIPLEGQGRMAEFVGELRAAPLINEAPTRYRVIRWQNNRWQVLCHVYGAASKFRSLQDKRVRVKGREYWIQGAAAPVLVPDQIQEAPAPD
ncbi:MAG: SH3 domain-containing protein [Opitutae bacterium]|jgi:hypothetical protein|nr:SH3 domain-containing protein [Kiritimatiellia bacterium]NCC92056.1 SH3 domain-containing protein [Opitutae bacterium]